MKRLCDGCGTPLEGRRRHGFVRGRRVVCGRKERGRTIRTSNGEKQLRTLPSPECS